MPQRQRAALVADGGRRGGRARALQPRARLPPEGLLRGGAARVPARARPRRGPRARAAGDGRGAPAASATRRRRSSSTSGCSSRRRRARSSGASAASRCTRMGRFARGGGELPPRARARRRVRHRAQQPRRRRVPRRQHRRGDRRVPRRARGARRLREGVAQPRAAALPGEAATSSRSRRTGRCSRWTRSSRWRGTASASCSPSCKKFEDARNAFGRAIHARPSYAEAHYNLGFTLSNLGDFEGALRATRRALELDPFYVRAEVRARDRPRVRGSRPLDRAGARRARSAWSRRWSPSRSTPRALDALFTELKPPPAAGGRRRAGGGRGRIRVRAGGGVPLEGDARPRGGRGEPRARARREHRRGADAARRHLPAATGCTARRWTATATRGPSRGNAPRALAGETRALLLLGRADGGARGGRGAARRRSGERRVAAARGERARGRRRPGRGARAPEERAPARPGARRCAAPVRRRRARRGRRGGRDRRVPERARPRPGCRGGALRARPAARRAGGRAPPPRRSCSPRWTRCRPTSRRRSRSRRCTAASAVRTTP